MLVTGGCGYIGSHTIVVLQEAGHDVICVDNCSNSDASTIAAICEITGKTPLFYPIDLCDAAALAKVFDENPDIAAIIHFAAFKAVGESVENPVKYYYNNLVSLLNLLREVERRRTTIQTFVFSSSCTVYGEPEHIPVSEDTPEKPAESPYGATKQMCERILRDFVGVGGSRHPIHVSLLRYFNPAGAHPSLKIGERGYGPNLVPRLVGVASQKQPSPFRIFGGDYATADGTPVRDFIHVCDIAEAHRLAIEVPPPPYPTPSPTSSKGSLRVLNLGAGRGITVLEALQTFVRVSDVDVSYEIGPRRPGDVSAIYADNRRACHELGWTLKYDLSDIMRTAWDFERRPHI